VRTGALTLLPDLWAGIRAVDWLPDGRSLLLSASDTMASPSQIWQVFLDSGTRTRITNDVDDYSGVDAARDGSTLAVIQSRTIATLWSVDSLTGQGKQILSGRGDDGAKGIAWASTGDIVFSSSRSGTHDLWSVRPDGDRPRQVTVGAGGVRPRISDDGRWIVFGESFQIWKSGFDGSPPTPLTFGRREHTPVIGHDGWVYYLSLEPLPKPFRVRLAGGNPERLSDEYFVVTDVVPNGDLLGYTFDPRRAATGFAATMPPNGGPITRYTGVPVQFLSYETLRSAPGGMTVTFVHRDKGRAEVWQQPLNGGTAVQLTRGDDGDVFSYAWAPDDRHIVLSRGTVERDALLIHRK
jgi:WD40 repeat protein